MIGPPDDYYYANIYQTQLMQTFGVHDFWLSLCRIVESVGEGVTELKEGDHVLPVFTGECGHCRHCKSSKSNLCANNRIDCARGTMLVDNKSRFSTLDGKAINFFLGSTFSEYTVLEHENVVKVGPNAPLNQICVLSCGVTTGNSITKKKPKKSVIDTVFLV